VTNGDRTRSYYGRPIIKAPVWKAEIPAYLFTGGLAGASAALSAAARAAGNAPLARRSIHAALLGMVVSPCLLTRDLGRPRRFYNMLRVFKVTSPMSVGTWIVSAEGAALTVAAACDAVGILPRTRSSAHVIAGLLGLGMATYTGALVADSVVPVWHEARHELPLVFAASSAAAAGGAAAILTPGAAGQPARRLGAMGGLAAVLLSRVMRHRLGKLVAEPYRNGRARTYSRAAETASLAGASLMAISRGRRFGEIAGGMLLIAGSWSERFAVVEAGKASAADPAYTSLPQRARAAARGQATVKR
jgi:hypothetical protein